MSGVRKDVWLVIDADCPMSYEIESGGAVHVTLGGCRGGAHLVFEPTALARLVDLARVPLQPRVNRDAVTVLRLHERGRAASH